jgi:hypothetical protein
MEETHALHRLRISDLCCRACHRIRDRQLASRRHRITQRSQLHSHSLGVSGILPAGVLHAEGGASSDHGGEKRPGRHTDRRSCYLQGNANARAIEVESSASEFRCSGCSLRYLTTTSLTWSKLTRPPVQVICIPSSTSLTPARYARQWDCFDASLALLQLSKRVLPESKAAKADVIQNKPTDKTGVASRFTLARTVLAPS